MTYRRITPALIAFLCALSGYAAAQPKLPSDPLVIRDFTLQFDPAGTFSLSGAGWPSMAGSWTLSGNEVTLALQNPPKDCGNPGVYTFSVDSPRVSFALVKDDCQPRRMILDRSEWLPRGVTVNVAAASDHARRRFRSGPLPPVAPGAGHWPSFRGAEASGVADGQDLPDRWNPATRREHSVAHADSRARALEPDRVGRPGLRDERDQRPQGARPSSPDSTATATHPTIARAIAGCSTRSTSAPARSAGSAPRPKASRSTSATSSPPTPAPRPPPTAASSSPGSDRKVCYAYDVDGGLALEGRSRPRRHGRLRHPERTNGGRRARRSSGTGW